MLAHKSNHFPELLQIFSFFKTTCQNIDEELPERIRLMNLEELYSNIVFSQHETCLMKDILVFLLKVGINPKWEKWLLGNASHYFLDELKSQREDIFDTYFAQLALAQYMIQAPTTNDLSQKDCTYFYKIDTETKFEILKLLMKNVNINKIKTKTKEEFAEKKDKKTNENEQKKDGENANEQIKNKAQASSEILLLGDFGKNLYIFISSQPQYVLKTWGGNKWELLYKKDVLQLIKTVLNSGKNSNNLFLVQNLALIHSKFMVQRSDNPVVRIHKLKESQQERQRKIVKRLQSKLVSNNERYENYLRNFNNQCWGYFPNRKKYIESINRAESIKDLMESYIQFYHCSEKFFYKCLCDDENEVPEDKIETFYSTQVKPTCNIHTKPVKIVSNFGPIDGKSLMKRLLGEVLYDRNVLFEAIVSQNAIVLDALELKQRVYLQNAKKKSLKKLNSQPDVSFDNSEGTSDEKIGTKLRQRKKKTKVLGVTMLDSDASEDESNRTETFMKYEYKTRNRC